MRKFLFFMVAVLMLTSSKYALAQQTFIDCKVISNKVAALSGATVKSGNISALTGGNGEFSIRVAVGAKLPFSAGPQHTQNYTEAMKTMLTEVNVVELTEPEQIFDVFVDAYNSDKSTLVIEYSDYYGTK